MLSANLKNISIKKLQDKNFNDYYLIVDNDTDNAYFCFQKSVKDGWSELVSNWENISEVELEFETNDKGNNKVVSVFVPSGTDFII